MNSAYTQFSRMRSGQSGLLLALPLILCFFCMTPATARAGWQIDEARFHVSAHKDLACADCHETVSGADRHPDATAVGRTAPSAFNREQCLVCHDAVQAELDKAGTHGGRPVQSRAKYANCVVCHNPHTVMLKEGVPPSFDKRQPVLGQCNVCHESRTALPALAKDDENCMSCHRKSSDAGSDRLCLSCHGAEGKAEGMPEGAGILDQAKRAAATHQTLTCTACHKKSLRFPHDRQERLACTQCHKPHGESEAHDAHIGVACESCHLAGATPLRKLTADGRGAGVGFAVNTEPLLAHDMRFVQNEDSCARCHFSGNTLGASATALPAKSLLCMGCHAATFTVGDAATFPFLLFFCAALLVLGSFWLSRAFSAPEEHAHPPAPPAVRCGRVMETVVLDVLLQRRLYRENKERWGIHALIFFPFVFRFLWGMTALLTSLWMPGRELPWLLLDKNNALGGLLFDLSGLALLAGLVLAARYWLRHPYGASGASGVSGMPRRDWAALALLGGITVVGFALEGMRIAMTGIPDGSAWSFAGYLLAAPIRALLSGQTLTEAYSTVWYAHALLTGATVAYIPFSQLRHILTSPLYLICAAWRKEK